MKVTGILIAPYNEIRPFDQSERNRAKERKEANMTPKPENYPYPLSLNEYQADAAATMIYKWKVIYPALGLARRM